MRENDTFRPQLVSVRDKRCVREVLRDALIKGVRLGDEQVGAVRETGQRVAPVGVTGVGHDVAVDAHA